MSKNKLEIKQLQIKARKFDSESGIFEGYASVFGNLDSDGDIVDKGAYANFLADDWSRVKILILHNDQLLPIGKPLEMYEDDIGLYLKAKISDTSMGLDVRQLLKDKVLDELSIGYMVLDSYMDTDGNRHLSELELQEISIVTWAANGLAKILEVKSQDINAENANPDILLQVAAILEQQAKLLRKCAEAKSDNVQTEDTKTVKNKYVLPTKLSGLHSKKGSPYKKRK